jgi:OOP family OmpA-OmpF porin
MLARNVLGAPLGVRWESRSNMRKSRIAALLAAVGVTLPAAARAQEGGFALNQFQPTPAGDVFFGVPGPSADGHLEPPKAYAMFDYLHRPIRSGEAAVVSAQGFMRLDVSWALWDRLLVSVDAPLAVVLSGDADAVPGTTFAALESPSFGDLRIGLRGRLFGEDGSPFQLGLGSYLFAPTGEQDQYTGEGSLRGAFHLSVGGRVGSDVAFVYSVAAGTELRASDSPHALTYGAGAGILFAGDIVQAGAEFIGSTALGETIYLAATPVTATDAGTDAEILFGAKIRLLDGLTIGASAGPGLGGGVGTPIFRAVGMLGWTPLPAGPPAEDKGDTIAKVEDNDDDGIPDKKDACPEKAGEPNLDPEKNGCPPSDKDADGIVDTDDACPTVAGLANTDFTQNGCPADTDGDGFHDGIDACVNVEGDPSDDEKKRGCPSDDDGDGIVNGKDACPADAGGPSDDPTQSGCPDDPDGDGIRYAADACPRDPGQPNPDPKYNGCGAAKYVPRSGDNVGEIVILQKIEFQTYGDSLTESVTPNSFKVLKEIAAIINNHPELTLIEVQGHTDDSGEPEYNLELSQRRAESIRKWMGDKGSVDVSRLEAKGYGMTAPIADNRTRQGRQLNRRVQFVERKVAETKKKKS